MQIVFSANSEPSKQVLCQPKTAWLIYNKMKFSCFSSLRTYPQISNYACIELYKKAMTLIVKNKNLLSNLKTGNMSQLKHSLDIMSLAKQTRNKNFSEWQQDEAIAFFVILHGIQRVTQLIMRHIENSPKKTITLFIFGGVVEGGGEWYKELLKERCRYIMQLHATHKKILNKKIDFLFSTEGSERAIIGAVADTQQRLQKHAYSVCIPNKSNEYAIGIDLGGTHIRIGLVDLKKLEIIGKIIKIPTFDNNVEMERIHTIKKQWFNKNGYLKTTLVQNQVVKNEFTLNRILTNYNTLTNTLLAKIINQIRQIDLTDVQFISMAVAAKVASNGFIFKSTNLPLYQINLASILTKKLGLATYVNNDVSCAGLGELLSRPYTPEESLLAIGIGTGLGMRFISHNMLGEELYDEENM